MRFNIMHIIFFKIFPIFFVILEAVLIKADSRDLNEIDIANAREQVVNPCKGIAYPVSHPQYTADWAPYEDEKCIKAFASSSKTYKTAKEYCQIVHDADLVSIDIKRKQDFVEKYLKSEKILKNAWIGLAHKKNGIYEWADESDYVYKNWAAGSPKNKPDYCVQIQTANNTNFGKWSDVLCSDTSPMHVMCEKFQRIWSPKQAQMKITNFLKKSLLYPSIPLGFIYVQLPHEKPPKDIWPTLNWVEISSTYKGVFFRVVGGNASSFGDVQAASAPRITNAYRKVDGDIYEGIIIPSDGSESGPVYSGSYNKYAVHQGVSFKQSVDEVKPINMAIKIWKRTG